MIHKIPHVSDLSPGPTYLELEGKEMMCSWAWRGRMWRVDCVVCIVGIWTEVNEKRTLNILRNTQDFSVFMQILLISAGKQEIDVQGKAGVCFLSLVYANDQNKLYKSASICLPRLIL